MNICATHTKVYTVIRFRNNTITDRRAVNQVPLNARTHVFTHWVEIIFHAIFSVEIILEAENVLV